MLYPLLDPQGSGQLIPIVKIEIIAAIKLDSFCSGNNMEYIDYLIKN
jgi:hypothetical protein